MSERYYNDWPDLNAGPVREAFVSVTHNKLALSKAICNKLSGFRSFTHARYRSYTDCTRTYCEIQFLISPNFKAIPVTRKKSATGQPIGGASLVNQRAVRHVFGELEEGKKLKFTSFLPITPENPNVLIFKIG